MNQVIKEKKSIQVQNLNNKLDSFNVKNRIYKVIKKIEYILDAERYNQVLDSLKNRSMEYVQNNDVNINQYKSIIKDVLSHYHSQDD